MGTAALFSERAKKLGVRILTARELFHKSPEECAAVMGTSLETYLQFEGGEQSPSLPQLELLAYYLEISLDYFWDYASPDKDAQKFEQPGLSARLNLRNRVVGALLRKRRMDRGLSSAVLAEKAGISVEQLAAYESGRAAIPMPALELLSEALAWTVSAFEDDHGPVGAFFIQMRSTRDFQDLSPDLQRFVVQPVNRPYLELAKRLSEMDVDKLRGVAEGLLEITL